MPTTTRKTLYIFAGCLAIVALIGAGTAQAASVFDIEYPIADLGGCADRSACKQYCDDAGHADACLAFAQKYGLADKQAVEKTRIVQEEGGPGGCRGDACKEYCNDPAHETECVEYAVQKGFMTREDADRALRPGPGGCRGRACQQYCEDPAHQDECFEFAAANGLLPKEEIERIREFKKNFGDTSTGPGGCQGEEACRSYCEDPEHITECVSFAEEHGFVDKEQAKIIKKTAGKGPGGCKGTAECRAYCDDSAHQQECIDFAEQNGFMSAEEAVRARKFAGKEGPGGCRGQQCKDFCEQAGNEDACLEFAEREGLIPKEELARAKKFSAVSKEGGPGGCRGVQCRNYCEDPAHREECYTFAKEKGLISPEEQEHFDAGSKIETVMKTSGGPGGCRDEQACRSYCTDPSHVEECVAFGATHGGVKPEQARQMLKQFSERRFEARGGTGEFGSRGFEDFQRSEQDAGRRFEEFRALEEQFRGKEFPGFGGQGEFPGGPSEFPGGPGGNSGEGGSSFAGPGGCTSPAECIAYCAEHRDECFGGGPSGEHGNEGPGGFPEERGRARFGPPQLRGGLIKQFDQGELPEGFHQLPPEERERFFHDKFLELKPPEQGQFPGGGEFPHDGDTGGSFPGRPSEFPGRPGEFPGRPSEFPGGPGGTRPPFPPGSSEDGMSGRDFPGHDGGLPEGNFSPEGGFRPPVEGFRPPEGGFHPPEGSFAPPPVGSSVGVPGVFSPPPPPGVFAPTPSSNTFDSQMPPPPSDGSFVPPPPTSGTFTPPPSGDSFQSAPPPPPSTAAPFTKFFGSLLGIF